MRRHVPSRSVVVLLLVMAVGVVGAAPALAALPKIKQFSPISGPAGTSVTILGANFTGATSVQFNGAMAVYTVNSVSKITATVPSGATTGPIAVDTPGGTAISPGNFTVVPPDPAVSLSEAAGPPRSSVTISGTNFGSNEGVAAPLHAARIATMARLMTATIRRDIAGEGTTARRMVRPDTWYVGPGLVRGCQRPSDTPARDEGLIVSRHGR